MRAVDIKRLPRHLQGPLVRFHDPPIVTGSRLFRLSFHDGATSVQSAIADAIFQITGKRFRDLPYGHNDLSWT